MGEYITIYKDNSGIEYPCNVEYTDKEELINAMRAFIEKNSPVCPSHVLWYFKYKTNSKLITKALHQLMDTELTFNRDMHLIFGNPEYFY